ncbi:nectin-1 isoform x5 [Limosa lapponica baueri]|uniref:Nectin-1 isoform x5 n=1 Tax=Limosa lapponica baueri TaxID=1758121 RepID=A0A2I0U1U3_LIMLA|nr:nectin-1 isoform x5 [Limosa lapponica baueri]
MLNLAGYEGVGAQGALETGQVTEHQSRNMRLSIPNSLRDKPLPQGAPGGIIGIVGGVIAAVLIIGVAVTVIIVYRRQQKNRTETDNDLIDLPPSHKPAPPPKRKQEMKSHLTAEDIQVVHLDNMKHEEEIQKLPLQTPYYDMAATEPTPYTDKLNSGNKDCDVHYAELDTSALASSPSPRTSIHAGGDLVEYATIQPNLR